MSRNTDFASAVQIGIVVRDIEKTRALWAELLGVEQPPIVETQNWESTHMMFKGSPSEGRAKLTFFKLENISLELIQPIGEPSTWQNFLEKNGDGIHHMAFRVTDLEAILEMFKRIGVDVEQKGETKGGGYLYMNSKSKLGAIIELLHRRT